jgi:hypothetical protein
VGVARRPGTLVLAIEGFPPAGVNLSRAGCTGSRKTGIIDLPILENLDFAGFLMPNQPESASALERLDAALGHVADCLAGLPSEELDRLHVAEAFEVHCLLQFFAVEEVGDRLPPALTLGNRVIALFAERYPVLAQDAAGTA